MNYLFHFLWLVGYPMQDAQDSNETPDEQTPEAPRTTVAWGVVHDKPSLLNRVVSGARRWPKLPSHCWTKFKQRAVFGLFVCIQALFIIRTLMPIWYFAEESGVRLSSTVVAAVSYTMCWTQIFLVYLASYPTVKSNLSKLNRCIREYEHDFGYSFDTSWANRKLKHVIVGLHVSQIGMTVMYFPLLITLVPDFKKQLFPWHDAEHGLLALATVLISLCLVFVLEAALGTSFALYVVSIVARAEFLHIAKETDRVFTQRAKEKDNPDRVRTLSANDKFNVSRSNEGQEGFFNID